MTVTLKMSIKFLCPPRAGCWNSGQWRLECFFRSTSRHCGQWFLVIIKINHKPFLRLKPIPSSHCQSLTSGRVPDCQAKAQIIGQSSGQIAIGRECFTPQLVLPQFHWFRWRNRAISQLVRRRDIISRFLPLTRFFVRPLSQTLLQLRISDVPMVTPNCYLPRSRPFFGFVSRFILDCGYWLNIFSSLQFTCLAKLLCLYTVVLIPLLILVWPQEGICPVSFSGGCHTFFGSALTFSWAVTYNESNVRK